MLKELQRLNTREGATILGAAVLDDVLVVILLAFMMSLTGAEEGTSIGLLIMNKGLFFVPVFFVSIGLNVSFAGLTEQIWFLIIITLMACATKLLGCWIGARITGFDNKASLIIGSGMVSRGEVALIIAATGLSSNLLAPKYFTSIVIMVIVTTLVTPPLLKLLYAGSEQKKPMNE